MTHEEVSMTTRIDGRRPNQLRPITLKTGVLDFAEGSCQVEFGKTRVLCAASVEDRQPPFLSITFRLRKLPDVVGGVSQGLRRRSLRERERLSERTIPGHAKLPYRQMAPNAAE
jgi:ribonuclease PH